MGAYRSYDHIDHVSNPFEMITGAITLPRRLKKVGLDEDILYPKKQRTLPTDLLLFGRELRSQICDLQRSQREKSPPMKDFMEPSV